MCILLVQSVKHLSSFVLVMCLVISHVQAQSPPKLVGRAMFTGIDDWIDLPVFYFQCQSKQTPQRCAEIIVWPDGRIAWLDIKNGRPYFYKSKLHPSVVNGTIKKVVDKDRELRRDVSKFDVFCRIGASLDNFECVFFVSQFYKRERWNMSALGPFEKNRQLFELRDHDELLRLMNLLEMLWSWRLFRQQYLTRDARTSYALSDQDKVDIAFQYAKDCLRFLFFEETIKGLVKMVEEDIMPQKVILTEMQVQIYYHQDTNIDTHRSYSYVVSPRAGKTEVIIVRE